ncbi:hypothetical protein ACIP98_37010 [Streptomyces sp. NPDC088354]|uniref:hypothetical protein n=1 Tax=Streptomyces sp. NPDC088354 TaxID=3365856 RepID=UPI003811B58D
MAADVAQGFGAGVPCSSWSAVNGAPVRVVELFAGPGGWSEGIAKVLGSKVDAVGVDISEDAWETAESAPTSLPVPGRVLAF